MDENMDVRKLISKILLISDMDDNDIRDIKIQLIRTVFQRSCSKADKFRKVIKYLVNEWCLIDVTHAYKFAILAASDLFLEFKMYGLFFKNLLLAEIQNIIKSAAVWIKKKSDNFYNLLTLIGIYYNKARIMKRPITDLVPQLITLLQMLIVAKSARASRTLVAQLALNGSMMMVSHSANIDELIYSVRQALLNTSDSSIKLWLQSAIDLSKSKYKNVKNNFDSAFTKMLQKDYHTNQLNIMNKHQSNIAH